MGCRFFFEIDCRLRKFLTKQKFTMYSHRCWHSDEPFPRTRRKRMIFRIIKLSDMKNDLEHNANRRGQS